MSTDFKNNVKEWDKLNTLIKQYEDNLKELRQQKKKIQEVTICYMREHEIDICNLGDGKLACKKSKVKINNTTKKALPEKIRDYFMEKENMDENIANMRAEAIVEYIYSKAEYKENYTLSRTKKRKNDDN